MKTSTMLKWGSAIFELVLAVPIIGGLIVMGTSYVALGFAFVLHLITLIVSTREQRSTTASIAGIITSVLGWIPFLGWLLHTVTAIMLLISAYRNEKVIVATIGSSHKYKKHRSSDGHSYYPYSSDSSHTHHKHHKHHDHDDDDDDDDYDNDDDDNDFDGDNDSYDGGDSDGGGSSD